MDAAYKINVANNAQRPITQLEGIDIANQPKNSYSSHAMLPESKSMLDYTVLGNLPMKQSIENNFNILRHPANLRLSLHSQN